MCLHFSCWIGSPFLGSNCFSNEIKNANLACEACMSWPFVHGSFLNVFQLYWPLCFPPQGLCTCCFLCLESSPPYHLLCSWTFLAIQISVQRSPAFNLSCPYVQLAHLAFLILSSFLHCSCYYPTLLLLLA